MALRDNYKDDIFESTRKYQQIKNDDGTYSFIDVTSYTQEGDLFGANDVNAINMEVNKIQNVVEVTLLASGWSATAPHSQRVAVSGIKATDNPRLLLNAPKTLSAADVKLRVKYTAMITDGESADGYMTFYCAVKKPDGNFSVKLEGVSVNG